MTNLLWPVWLDDIWAKSPEEEGKSGESLARHTWQVLKSLSDMIRLRPYLPEKMGFPGLWHSLFWACFLHDLGKSARGFQSMLREGSRWPHRHEVLSLAFFPFLEGTFSREEYLCTAAAVAYHHRDSHEISLLYSGLGSCSLDVMDSLVDEVDDGVLKGLWSWLADFSPMWINALNLSSAGVRPPVIAPLEKFLALFRTEGSHNLWGCLKNIQRWEREMNRSGIETLKIVSLALRGHINTCDYTASAHAGSLLQTPIHSPGELLTRWGLSEHDLYPHQKACLETKGSTVLIAPTGSGKTESALLWACSQVCGDKPPPRLFYTLPYQASMNAMYDRLNINNFPGLVGLEHSRSTLALYRRYMDDNYDRQQALRLARWTGNLSRLHYFPVRVLSPYQILKGAYRLKGYEALLTDFLGAIFIFDEIHAYEVKRLAAILAMVKYLRENLDAHFFVMSATLPDLLLDRLTEVLGLSTKIKAIPELFSMFQRHRLFVREGDLLQEKWLNRISREALEGKSVLVCCNTVKRAQQAYSEMFRRLKGESEVVLLHGRFTGRDRLVKEKEVQAYSGSRSALRRPVVLVATQVVEVSLDIDLDVIYTDPAPLEALVQRFGRINRRRLKKWAPVYVFSEPSDGQKIYERVLVQKSLEVLKKNSDKMIDESEISGWLNTIYQGEISQNWNETYRNSYEIFEAACLRNMRAFDTNESLEEMFYKAFDSIEVLPVCLENEYRTLILDNPLEASQLLVPLSWRQFSNLRRKGMAGDGKYGYVKVVDMPYDPELGLQFTYNL